MSSIEKLLRNINAKMITTNAFVALESLFQHDKTIEIMRETKLTEKEDRSVLELNFLCDFQII